MAVASRKIRSRMLMTTALAAITAIPGVAHAQLVRSTDLSSAVDSGGNPNQVTVTDTSATQTDIEVEAAVVVAEWTDFNIGLGDTVNVTIDAGLGLSEATLFNRVIGGNPSNINGTLNAAGINFWLVNQNGILFGNDTSINAQSFFASTLDVANQDVFDFYEATDVFGNGTDTLNFSGVATNAVQALGNASFVTDGSLAFVSQQLDLTGSFDAGTGRAIFVTASDVDVSFTAGSPLTYTVNGGTTVAAQTIDGTIQGASAEFAMFTAAGVVGALLDIDATVTATTAVPTDTGIALLASGPSSVTVEIGGEFSSTGEVVLNSNGDLTATANISGSDLDIDATGAIGVLDLTSSDGNVNANAGTTITAGVIDTSGNGGAILTAAGNITTTSITSNEPGATNGFIDVESTGGGTLDLGALSSDGDIALDTSGLITTSTITTLNDLTIGGTTTATTVTFTGNVDADIIDIDATGTVSGLAIDATDGNLDINAGVIDVGAVSATEGDVILQATGNITTTSVTSNEGLLMTGGAIDIDSTGGGTLDLGSLTADGAANLDTTGTLTPGVINIGGALVIGATNDPTTLNLTDSITAGSFVYTTANPFVSQDITTTDGDLDINAASITTGVLDAENGGGVILTSPGNITTTSITSNEPGATNGFIDVESTGGGTLDLGALSSDGDIALDTSGLITTSTITTLNDLTIGGTTTATTVTFTGNVDADIIDIDATGTVSGLAIDATDGNLDINAGVIDVGAVSATEGDVILQATGNITTTSVTSNEGLLMTGGAIDIDSTGGSIDLGTVNADGLVDVDAFVNITTGDVTTVAGDINLNAGGAINTGALDANDGGGAILTAVGNITTTSITSNEPGATNGFIDVESTGGGTLDLGALSSDGDIALDTTGALTTDTISSLGDLTIGGTATPTTVTFTGNVSADMVDIDATGAVAAQDIDATDGDLNILAGSISGGHFTATRGDLILSATGAITTTSITAERVMGTGGSIDVDSTGGGNLNLGDITADSNVTIDTLGILQYNDLNAPGGLVDIGSTAMPSMIIVTGSQIAIEFIINSLTDVMVNDLTATAGVIDIDAPNISAGHLSATGGDVTLTAPGNITTTSITSIESGGMGGAIDVDSTAGGTLDLGNLVSDGLITLDTTGSLTVGTVNAGGALDIGSTAMPTTVNLTGNIVAASFAFTTLNPFVSQDITTTAGDINIDAASIMTGVLDANGGGGVILTSPGNIITTSITANEPGVLNGFIDVQSTGGGTLDLGALTSDGNIDLDTSGLITTSTITTLGDLTIGGTITPTTVTFTGNVDADIIDINATGTVSGLNIDATDGNLDINAGAIVADHVSATGGDVILQATGNITTTSITSNEDAFMIGGAIDVDSTGGGTLDLGTITADGQANFDTTGTLTLGLVNIGGALVIGATNDPTTLNLTDNITAGSFAYTTLNPFVSQDITTTDGDLDINAASIATGALDANNGGGVILTSPGNITTTSITANEPGVLNGFIDVQSTGGGTLDLGALTSDGNIDLDTSGLVTTTTITALGDLTIGGTTTATTVTFTGNVDADAVSINATGTVTGLAIDATDGNLDISAGAIDAGDLSATGGDVNLRATGNIDAASITANEDFLMVGGAINVDAGGAFSSGTVIADGALTVGAVTNPSSVLFTGAVTAESIDVDSTGAIDGQDLTTNAGDLDLTAGTTINVQALDANGGGGVILLAPGDITTTSITANEPGVLNGFVDVESTGGGTLDLGAITSDGSISLDTSGLITANTISTLNDLTIGGTIIATTVTFSGNVSGDVIDITATGAVSGQDVTATDGNLAIDASSIDIGAASATGGDVVLTATGNITTTSITANEDFLMMGGAIDVDSTSGGALNLGDLTADGDVDLDTSGSVMASTVMAGGAFDVGSTNVPFTVSLSGNVTAASVSMLASASISGLDVTANAGSIDVEANQILFDALEATDNVELDGATSITLASVTADSDVSGVGSVLIGAATAPVTLTVSGDTTGASVTATAGTADLADVTSTAGAIALTATSGGLTTGNLTSNGAAATIELRSTGVGGNVSTGTINSDGDTIFITAAGDITSGAVATSLMGVPVAGSIGLHASGSVTTGQLSAGEDIRIETASGAVTLPGATAGDDFVIDAGGAVDLQGLVSVDGSGPDTASISFAGAPGTSNLVVAAETLPGSNIEIDAAGALTATDLTTSTGEIDIDAGSIAADAINAMGGGVALTSTIGGVTTNSIDTVGGSIAVDSTSGGALDLGNLTSDMAISLNTSGSVTAATVGATGALTVGAMTAPSSVTFTGNVTAGSIDIDTTAAGSVTALDLTATAGDIDIDAGSIDADDLNATNNIALDGAGTFSFANIAANGDLSIGTFTVPGLLTITGTASGMNASLHSTIMNVNTVTATGGDVVLSGGTLTVGTAQATNNVIADATTSITADVVTADSDTSGMGDVEVGLNTQPNQLTINTSVTGVNVTLAADMIDLINGLATAGDLTLIANTIDLTDVTATGGDVSLQATGDVTTQSITATAVGMSGGNIDVDSSAGGALDLGNLDADAGITLDTSGAVEADVVNAVGAVQIGSASMPSSVTFNGNVTAGSIDIDMIAGGSVAASDLTANAGDIDIDTGSLTASAVSATGDIAIDGSGTVDLASATADSDADLSGDLSIGSTTAPSAISIGGASTGANVRFSATNNVAAGTVTATAGDVTIVAPTVDAQAVQATNNVTIDGATSISLTTVTADSDSNLVGDVRIGTNTAPDTLALSGAATGANVALEAGNSLTADTVTATAGDVAIQSGGTATTQDVTASGGVTISSGTTLTSQNVSALGGDVVLSADDVTAQDVLASGDVFVDGSSSINLASATADSDGDLSGDLNLGTITAPDSIAVAGASTGAMVTIRSDGSLNSGSVTATAGDVSIDTGDTATTADILASGSVTVQTATALNTQAITATGGDVMLTANDVSSQAVQAAGDVTVDGASAVSLASAAADSDMNGVGNLAIGTATAPSSLTVTGASSGVSTTLVSAGTIAADTVEATGGDATLTAATTVSANSVSATGGAIDVDSTGGGSLDLGDLTASTSVALDTTGTIAAGEIIAGGALTVGGTAAPSSVAFAGNATAGSVEITSTGGVAGQDITANAGSVVVDASEIAALAVAATDSVTLDATGEIDLASAVADSEGNGAGDLTIGATNAPSDLTIAGTVSGANVSLASAGTTTTGAVSATPGDVTITSDGAVTIASVSSNELAIQTGALLTIGAVNAAGSAVLESADVDLQDAVDVNGASLVLRSAPGTSVGIGSGSGDYQLSDAELALIETGSLTIDAVDQEIEIGDVTFTDQAGADEVILATAGAGAIIRITGDLTGAGSGRLFRFGADAATGDMLSERIIMNIDDAAIDFGDAILDLRAEDIVFGQQALIDDVAGRDSSDLAVTLVGDADSLLFNPFLAGGLGPARTADPVYVRAGDLTVTYGNSALFQNTAPPQEGGTLFTGLVLGQPGGDGTLTLNPSDDTNTFAFFGQINELVGTATALAGGNVIFLNGDVRLPDSRVNGCIIGSGADCVTTIIGTTTVSIPREVVELLTADSGLLVPFDPLVGTNNEGLFSDAAVDDDEDCERDENGACVQ